MKPAQALIKASTQEHLNIEDVRDDIVILKDGSCCLVLQTTAVNFNLLSEAEQDATIYAYAGLLNSLSFPIQIFIRSQKKDISSYLLLLRKQENKQKSSVLKKWIKQYQKFIEKTVKENEVLDKDFYLIIPFSLLELGISQALKKGFAKGKSQLPLPKEQILERAKTNLYPKRDHLIKQFNRLGLQAAQLTTKELIQLFFNIYNPESGSQKLSPAPEYSTFLVEPAVEETAPSPTPAPASAPTPASPLPPTPAPASPLPPTSVPPADQKPAAKISTVPQQTAPKQETTAPEGIKLQKTIDNMIEKVKGKQ